MKTCPHNDYSLYSSRLSSVVPKINYKSINLGIVDKYPLLLLTPKIFKKQPNILIAAGFHGNETAPIWALLKVLEDNNLPTNLNVSFLPLINPTGFIKNKRDNMFFENPNRGYAYNYGKERLPRYETVMSIEGKFIMAKIKTVLKCASTSLLTMHEDDIINKFFIYTSTHSHLELENKLLKIGSDHFSTIINGKDEENNKIKNGLIIDVKDGSFEDYLFRQGTPQCITTETPSNKNFDERVATNITLLNTYLKYYSNRQDY